VHPPVPKKKTTRVLKTDIPPPPTPSLPVSKSKSQVALRAGADSGLASSLPLPTDFAKASAPGEVFPAGP
jgi:hypothetical protein